MIRMPRRITTWMGLVAAVAAMLGVSLWYVGLDGDGRAPIAVVVTILLANAAAWSVVLGPIVVADLVTDWRARRGSPTPSDTAPTPPRAAPSRSPPGR